MLVPHGVESVRQVAVVRRKTVVIVVNVHDPRETKLAEIVQTFDRLGLELRLAQRWQKQAREDGDDGDHDQQFDQGESGLAGWPRGERRFDFHHDSLVHHRDEEIAAL